MKLPTASIECWRSYSMPEFCTDLPDWCLENSLDCNPGNPSDPHLSIDQVQDEYVEKIKCPVVGNFQYGHIPRKLTVPIGLLAMLDTKRSRIEVLESAVI